MECGQRLLGVLELGGAIIITTGLAIRAAVQQVYNKSRHKNPSLDGNRVLIIGTDRLLQNELAKQFILRGCHVARAELTNIKNDSSAKVYVCNPINPKQLAILAKQLDEEFGELDIVVHTTEVSRSPTSEPIDEIVEMIENSFMENFHVASQFIPDLARRSGCFVTVEPQKSRSGTFSATKNAINSLSDALTQRLSSNIHILRAHRRVKKRNDKEDMCDSAIAILNAIETGQNSITLPTAMQHIKNIFRRIYMELSLLWKDTIRQQKINHQNHNQLNKN